MKSRLIFFAILAIAAKAEGWNEKINSMWSTLKGMPVWNSISEASEYVLNVSWSQIEYIVKWILEYNDPKIIKAACTAAGAVAGTFAPSAFYSFLSVSSTGPVAGGLFASAQSYGVVFSTL